MGVVGRVSLSLSLSLSLSERAYEGIHTTRACVQYLNVTVFWRDEGCGCREVWCLLVYSCFVFAGGVCVRGGCCALFIPYVCILWFPLKCVYICVSIHILCPSVLPFLLCPLPPTLPSSHPPSLSTTIVLAYLLSFVLDSQ